MELTFTIGEADLARLGKLAKTQCVEDCILAAIREWCDGEEAHNEH